MTDFLASLLCYLLFLKQKNTKTRHNDINLFLGAFFNETILIYNFLKKHAYGTFTETIQKVRGEHQAQ